MATETEVIALLSSDLRSRRGVGDFSRRIARELENQGVVSVLEDRSGRDTTRGSESGTETVFLQFVPYAWHARGVISAEVRDEIIRRCGGRKTIVYLHELWIGESLSEGWRNRLLGRWQRRAVLRLLSELTPKVVLTSNSTYQSILADSGVKSEILPLPSNIPLPSESEVIEASAWLEQHDIGDDRAVLGGIFGSIHPEWNPLEMLREWREAVVARGKEAVLLTLGWNGQIAPSILAKVEREVAGVRIVKGGMMAPGLLAGVLERVTVGFATTPWALIGKSGSVAAFRASGVPVVVIRDDWKWRKAEAPIIEERDGLRRWRRGFNWVKFESERKRTGPTIEETTGSLLSLVRRVSAETLA